MAKGQQQLSAGTERLRQVNAFGAAQISFWAMRDGLDTNK